MEKLFIAIGLMLFIGAKPVDHHHKEVAVMQSSQKWEKSNQSLLESVQKLDSLCQKVSQ